MGASLDLHGRRVAVVGASSGLGHAIGTGLAHQGAAVAFVARRADLLQEAAAEAGNGSLAVTCDVRDEADVARAVDDVVMGLGGLDALVYAAGVGHLARLRDTDAEQWRSMLEVNVVGAALVTRAALAHLEPVHGTALYLSSVSASLTDPWPGLGAYAASKAALDKLVEAWRSEHPAVSFSRVIVGDTAGGEGRSVTQFADAWEADLSAELMTGWIEQGLVTGSLIDVQDLVDAVGLVIGSGADIRSLTIVARQQDPGS